MRNFRVAPILAVGVLALLLAGCSREPQDWATAQQTDTAQSYQKFMQQHPNSSKAPQAQARIKQLAEDRDWQTAAAADTRNGYEQFVAQHADSKYAQEARIRIENFAQLAAANPAGAPGSTAPATAAVPAGTSISAGAPAGTAGKKVSVRPAAPATSHKAPATSGKAAGRGSATTHASARSDRHDVQLGAFGSKASAESAWKTLEKRFPSTLRGREPHFVAARSGARSIYRLRVGTTSDAAARVLCSSLKKHGQACLVVSG